MSCCDCIAVGVVVAVFGNVVQVRTDKGTANYIVPRGNIVPQIGQNILVDTRENVVISSPKLPYKKKIADDNAIDSTEIYDRDLTFPLYAQALVPDGSGSTYADIFLFVNDDSTYSSVVAHELVIKHSISGSAPISFDSFTYFFHRDINTGNWHVVHGYPPKYVFTDAPLATIYEYSQMSAGDTNLGIESTYWPGTACGNQSSFDERVPSSLIGSTYLVNGITKPQDSICFVSANSTLVSENTNAEYEFVACADRVGAGASLSNRELGTFLKWDGDKFNCGTAVPGERTSLLNNGIIHKGKFSSYVYDSNDYVYPTCIWYKEDSAGNVIEQQCVNNVQNEYYFGIQTPGGFIRGRFQYWGTDENGIFDIWYSSSSSLYIDTAIFFVNDTGYFYMPMDSLFLWHTTGKTEWPSNYTWVPIVFVSNENRNIRYLVIYDLTTRYVTTRADGSDMYTGYSYYAYSIISPRYNKILDAISSGISTGNYKDYFKGVSLTSETDSSQLSRKIPYRDNGGYPFFYETAHHEHLTSSGIENGISYQPRKNDVVERDASGIFPVVVQYGNWYDTADYSKVISFEGSKFTILIYSQPEDISLRISGQKKYVAYTMSSYFF